MVWQELAGPQRIKNMQSAIALLRRWQESTFQLPLLENPSAFYQEKERIAALLVDNHLGKLARKVRLLGGENGLDSDSFLDEWAEITFITSLWTAFEKLHDGLKLNLIYQSGPNITKKHLTKEKSFKDCFLVVGRDFFTEERLLRRTIYVYACHRKRFYLLLDYSYNQQPFDRTYQVGEVYEGGAIEYPFPGSLRINALRWTKTGADFSQFQGMIEESIETAVRSYSHALKINPFCEPWPVTLKLSSWITAGGWIITDSKQHRVKINFMDDGLAPVFYAAAYNQSLIVFALCTKDGILPLSYFNGQYWLGLKTPGVID